MNPLTYRGIACLILLFSVVYSVRGQVSNVSIGTESVKDRAILWLKADGNQGLLLPVVSNRSAFTGLNNSDDKGMLIFDASDNKVYFWNGTAWIEAGGSGGGGGSNQVLTLSGNTFTLSGSPSSNVNLSSAAPQSGQALVWNGSAWTAVTLTGDATGPLGANTVSGLKGSALPATLPATTSALVYNGTAWAFQALSSTGEANTASNVGTAGVGVFRQKTGLNLEFFKINSGSNRVSVVADGVNNEVDIDVNQANLQLASTQITGLGALATLSSVGSAQISDGSVASIDILDGTITGTDIANTTITANKLAQSGATTGQVLKWNGTNWVPQNDDAGTGATPTLANGQILVGNGTTNSATTLTGDASLSGGTLTIGNGAVNSAKIQDGAITGADIANATVTADKLAQSGATSNQVLQWNGSAWAPATMSGSGTVTQVNAGTGLTGGPITTTGTISIATGGVGTGELANNAVTSAKISDGTITGADIAMVTIPADRLAQSSATSGQVLKWNGTNWAPAADNTGAGVPTLSNGQVLTGDGTNNIGITLSGDATLSGGTLTIADHAVTSAKIQNGTIAGIDIANTTITADKLAQSGATDGQFLRWSGSNWAPASVATGFSTLNTIPKGDGSGMVASQFIDNGTFVGLNTTSQVTGASRFTIGTDASSGSYGGMYIDTQTGGRPFYGFSQNAGGGAWIEWDGSDANKMKFYNSGSQMVFQSNGNLGLGTNSPEQRLDVVGYVRIGAGAGASNEGLLLATPSAGISQISAGARASTDFRIVQSNNAPMSFYSNGAERMRILGDGKVGIGVTSPSYQFQVRGTNNNFLALFENQSTDINCDGIAIQLNSVATSSDYVYFMRTGGLIQGRISANGSGAVTYSTTSDRRLKDNIREYNSGLSDVMKMQPRRYVFKADRDKVHIGFIAQELAEVYPDAVSGTEETTTEADPMMVDYSKLTPALVSAIQQQQAIIEELKTSRDNLEKRIAILEELLLKASGDQSKTAK